MENPGHNICYVNFSIEGLNFKSPFNTFEYLVEDYRNYKRNLGIVTCRRSQGGSEEFLQVKLPKQRRLIPNHINMRGSFANEIVAGTQHGDCGNEAIGQDRNDENLSKGQINERWLKQL